MIANSGDKYIKNDHKNDNLVYKKQLLMVYGKVQPNVPLQGSRLVVYYDFWAWNWCLLLQLEHVYFAGVNFVHRDCHHQEWRHHSKGSQVLCYHSSIMLWGCNILLDHINYNFLLPHCCQWVYVAPIKIHLMCLPCTSYVPWVQWE